MYQTRPPCLPRLLLIDHASVVFWICSGVVTLFSVTTSSYTRRPKWAPVGMPSTSPQASKVASFGLPRRLTTSPFWTLHFEACLSGRSQRMSGKSHCSRTLLSSSILIWVRNFSATPRVWLKIPIVISGSRRISWMEPAKVITVLL